jgi:serine/threonine-protein kinase ULK/ATG1
VLTSAGMRFFGSPASVFGSLTQRPWMRSPNSFSQRAQNPEEEALVQKLDELGQMASAMVEFADSKLALCTPNAVRPSPILGHSSISPSSYLQTAAARRRSSTASMASVDRSSARLDFLCAEALVVYVKALAFLQHGVDLARGHWESRVVSYGTPPTGPEFNESK